MFTILLFLAFGLVSGLIARLVIGDADANTANTNAEQY